MNVWGDTPLAPPTPAEGAVAVPEPVVKEAETVVEEPKEWIGLPVRADGDRVYLLKDGRKRWITSAEVFSNLGFKFGEEVRIDQATLSVIPEGEPVR